MVCRRHHRFLHEYGYRVVMHEGKPQFLQPNGREVSTMRPVAVDAAAGWRRLVEAHEELEIDESTGDSHWGGERMDYQWALQGLMGHPA